MIPVRSDARDVALNGESANAQRLDLDADLLELLDGTRQRPRDSRPLWREHARDVDTDARDAPVTMAVAPRRLSMKRVYSTDLLRTTMSATARAIIPAPASSSMMIPCSVLASAEPVPPRPVVRRGEVGRFRTAGVFRGLATRRDRHQQPGERRLHASRSINVRVFVSVIH